MDKTIITTSWDDGHPLDLKLAWLLQKHGIPATFYIPIDNTERRGMNRQEIKEIAQNFDVGGHTYHHVNLTRISPKEAETEIVEGKKRLEDIIGRELLSFCYPYGSFNDEIINFVKQAGFIGARTARLLIRRIKDPFKLGTTVYAKELWLAPYMKHSVTSLDLSLFCFMLKNSLFFKGWDRIATETFDFVIKNGGIWHLWGHSWEIEDNNEWGRLEEVLHKISTLSQEALKVDNSQLIKICSHRGQKGETS